MEKEQTLQIFEHLDKVYASESVKKQEERYKNLKQRFVQRYGEAPKFYCRAPGRVNIIGEHIDYCGYSVLPAAIEQDFVMAYAPVEEGEASDQIVVSNIDKDKYPEETLSTDPYQKLREDKNWTNYFLCGYKAILALDDEVRGLVSGKPKGLKIMIDSHVPPAAGLSSSSAFTVCAAVTTLHANGIHDKVSLQKLSNLTIAAERNAGTACGGMDQTISIMGEANCAKLIDFVP